MKTEAKSGQSGILSTIRTIVVAVLIAVVFRTFAFEPFNIPSGSMLPTLLVGDFLFVSKFSYGYSRYSLPLGLPIIPGRILASVPDRGDVAVFKLPSDQKVDYIKRVIGLPGDRIQIKAGRLHINDEIVERRPAGEFVDGDRFRQQRYQRFTEVLPNGVEYYILERSDDESLDNTPEFRVPPDHLFVMGDNRDNSADSRTSQVGFVPIVNLVGRADLLFFSCGGDGVFGCLLNIRWGRIFKSVSS